MIKKFTAIVLIIFFITMNLPAYASINDAVSTGGSYTLTQDATATDDLGSLGGNLVIDGEGYTIDGDSHSGVTVNSGQTLTIHNVSTTEYFYIADDAMFTAGTTVYSDSTKTTALGTITAIDANTGAITLSTGKIVYQSGKDQMIYATGMSGFVGSLYGGVICNRGTMNIDSVNFVDNSAKAGGAIFNTGTITNISGTFIGNSATSQGGVIANTAGRILNIEANFIKNSANSYGGAIYLEMGAISTITGNFIENTSLTASAGAIYNGAIISSIVGDFIRNGTQKRSGAIYNAGTISSITGDFIGNYTVKTGGAIHNQGGTISAIKGNFIGNNITTENQGGVIYNIGTIGILADGQDIYFSDNTAGGSSNAIYFAGSSSYSILNLSADADKKIVFNDSISSSSDAVDYNIININSAATALTRYTKLGAPTLYFDGTNYYYDPQATAQYSGSIDGYTAGGTFTGDGTVVLNADMSGFKGTVNLAGGTLKMGTGSYDSYWDATNKVLSDTVVATKTTEPKFFGSSSILNVTDNSTLDLQNNLIDSVQLAKINIKGELILNADADLANQTMDSIEATTATVAQDSKIIIGAINLISGAKSDSTTIEFIKSETLAGAASISGTYQTVIGPNNETYTLSFNPTTGELTYIKSNSNTGSGTGLNLETYLTTQQTKNSYEMVSDEIILNDLGKLNNGDNAVVTINGGGNTVDGNNKQGLVVGDGFNSKELHLVDTNIKGFSTTDQTGAITVKAGSKVVIVAKNKPVTFGENTTSGTNTNAIFLDSVIKADKDASIQDSVIETDKKAIVEIKTVNENVVTIANDIRSNNKENKVYLIGDGQIVFNGVVDPVSVHNQNKFTIHNNYIDDIHYVLEAGEVMFARDEYLANPTGNINSIDFAGGALNLANGAANTIDLSSITLSANSKIKVDADLANRTMDKIYSSGGNYSVLNGAKLTVIGINLISDATEAKTYISFAPYELKDYVENAVKGEIVYSSIYKYIANYDPETGMFDFTRYDIGVVDSDDNGNSGNGDLPPETSGSNFDSQGAISWSDDYQNYSPGAFAAGVAAQAGAFAAQLDVYEQVFANFDMKMLQHKAHCDSVEGKLKSYMPSIYTEQAKGGFVRPFTTFEKIRYDKGPKVSNVAYGTLAGLEAEMIELSDDSMFMWGAFAGYTGSHQTYDGVSIYQNGGVLGTNAYYFKGKFFSGLSLNVGASVAEATTSFGKDDLTMIMAGLASKNGYNFELAEGKMVIQPNFLMAYTFVNTFDYTSVSGARIDVDPLHVLTIAPGLKIFGNICNGWQPYIYASMMWHIMADSKMQAAGIMLPSLTMDPYFKYGIGLQKLVGERFSGYLQSTLFHGARNGIGLNFGFKWRI